MKNQYNKLIKRIITEAALGDDYSYNNIKDFVSPVIKQMRAEVQSISQVLGTINSIALRIQKGILDRESLGDVKKNWHRVNRLASNFLDLRNDLYADLSKNYDIKGLPDNIIKIIIGSLYRSASSILSLSHRGFKRCESESVENVLEDVNDCKHFIDMI